MPTRRRPSSQWRSLDTDDGPGRLPDDGGGATGTVPNLSRPRAGYRAGRLNEWPGVINPA